MAANFTSFGKVEQLLPYQPPPTRLGAGNQQKLIPNKNQVDLMFGCLFLFIAESLSKRTNPHPNRRQRRTLAKVAQCLPLKCRRSERISANLVPDNLNRKDFRAGSEFLVFGVALAHTYRPLLLPGTGSRY